MDMGTTYMGLELSSAFVPSASPLSRDVDTIRELADAGAGAVVLWSLFQEQAEHDAEELDFYLHYGADRFAESLTYFPEPGDYVLAPEQYIEHIAKVKAAVDIPIIASMNGLAPGGWTDYASQMQQAGADAIELNVYWLPTNPETDAARVEQAYLDVLASVKQAVSIPVAMKLSPYFSATANVLRKLDQAGADGLVLFNRFYQPDIDPEALEIRPCLELSSSSEGRLPQRWLAIAFGRVSASLAASTGVHTGSDAAKMIMAGADVVQVCSSLLKNGPGHLIRLAAELGAIADRHGYESVAQMRGVLSQKSCAEPGAYERANYMKTLSSFGRTNTLE